MTSCCEKFFKSFLHVRLRSMQLFLTTQFFIQSLKMCALKFWPNDIISVLLDSEN